MADWSKLGAGRRCCREGHPERPGDGAPDSIKVSTDTSVLMCTSNTPFPLIIPQFLLQDNRRDGHCVKEEEEEVQRIRQVKYAFQSRWRVLLPHGLRWASGS
uniref:Uncharacterized protein n=1 Tax=Seriola lalandi dorsalis TaxID=1841481 RepID=A0A3B4XF74_SERLL